MFISGKQIMFFFCSISFVAGSYGEVYRGDWHGTVSFSGFVFIFVICRKVEDRLSGII